MAHHLKQLDEKVTQEVFDRLPALLTAFQVRTITGLSDHELADAVRAGQILAFQRAPRLNRKRSYNKYTKVSVAKLVGFRV